MFTLEIHDHARSVILEILDHERSVILEILDHESSMILVRQNVVHVLHWKCIIDN